MLNASKGTGTQERIEMQKTLAIVILALLLGACTPAEPISDAQLKMIVEQCVAKGYATRIINSGLVNRAECAEVKREGHGL